MNVYRDCTEKERGISNVRRRPLTAQTKELKHTSPNLSLSLLSTSPKSDVGIFVHSLKHCPGFHMQTHICIDTFLMDICLWGGIMYSTSLRLFSNVYIPVSHFTACSTLWGSTLDRPSCGGTIVSTMLVHTSTLTQGNTSMSVV